MCCGMRKPDSLAQMAQCEGVFSENPEAFRGSFLSGTPAYGRREGRRGQVPLPLTLRHDHDETTALPALRRAACFAPVPPRDLPHQREAEASTLPRATAVERLEHALALGLGDARAAIANHYLRAVFGAGDAHFDRRSSVALRVLQQVADHPAQQPRIAAHGDRLAVECGGVVARAFFR